MPDLVGPVTIDQIGCARCDGDGHDQLTFQPLTHPVTIGPGTRAEIVFTHWAPCPTNGEPILLTLTVNPDA